MSGLMSGIVLTGHGGPDMLEWRDDLPRPEPGPGEVRVRVTGSAVNNTDINTRVGWYSRGSGADDAGWSGSPIAFPLIQGIDACGRIDAVGPGVDPARIGERVLVEPCLTEQGGKTLDRPKFLGSDIDGAFAEYLTVAAIHAHRIESDLGDVELATFPCSYSTAENMLARADVGSSDRVLVTGASGGVGSAVVQLACARGAEVLAVSSPAMAGALRALGAAEVLPRNGDLSRSPGPGSVDVVVDLVGGPGFPALIGTLRRAGRYAVAGAVAGPEVALDLRILYLNDLTFFGCTALGPGVFADLVARIERKEIAPLLAEAYDLRDMTLAQAAFSRKGYLGKIGLRVAGAS